MKNAHGHKFLWSSDSMPLVPKRYRSVYTVLIPLIDASILLFGITSLFIGSKIVSQVTVPWFPPAWAIVTIVGSSLSLAGLITLHDRLELVGRFAVGVGLLIYFASTGLAIFTGNPSSTLTLLLTATRVIATIWRINDLAGELARKEAAHGR